MKVTHPFFERFHLDRRHGLLSARNCMIVKEFFNLLDARGMQALDDTQFVAFMRMCTDLTESQIYNVFDMLDVDASGLMEFDEFYLLVCILTAIKDHEEKMFLYNHSRTVFDLLDADGSGNVSAAEFETFGFLFNFYGPAINQIFSEFDVSGDLELDYGEFKMFALACIEKQTELEEKMRRRREERLAAKGTQNRVVYQISSYVNDKMHDFRDYAEERICSIL
eukprot:Nk52_evm8s375 gene=Nk52_evmTU8s375